VHVLLVNPDESLARSPNLGLGYLASAVRAAGHVVRLVDVCQLGASRDTVAAAISESRWDVVGLQAYSCGYHEARRVAQQVKAALPSAAVVLGGRHASALPEEVLSDERAVDFVVAGDGEEPFTALLTRIAKGEAPDVPGVWWRDGDVIRGSPSSHAVDLTQLEIPAWDLIAPARYPVAPVGAFVRATPIAPIITSRGCPYSCAFCAAPSQTKTVRFRAPAAVVDEIELLVRVHGAREIQILDDNFTLNRSHAVAVLEALLARGLGVALSLPNGVRLDRLDGELVELLERAGCYSVAVGIDSGSQRILDEMGRCLTVDRMEEQIHLIRRHSQIRLTGNFILGLPGETPEDLSRTLEFALRLPLDRAYFGMYLPLPGSELFARLRSAGKLDGLDYASLSPRHGAPVYVPDGLTASGVTAAVRSAYVRFYARPRVIAGILREIKDVRHAAFLVRKALQAWQPHGRRGLRRVCAPPA
jgi:radical SAM superfamily enzyme YgiQ (UPF0313 family)